MRYEDLVFKMKKRKKMWKRKKRTKTITMIKQILISGCQLRIKEW